MQIIKRFGKITIAGIIAIVILSLILNLYYYLPPHKSNPNLNTDFIYPANSFWIKCTEGIGWGRFDANGYNNPAVVTDPDIIILGSSHMEATNVRQNETTAVQLQCLLNDKYSVYNLGIAGHDFATVCQYLPTNLELYSPKITIIETASIDITQDLVDSILQKSVAYTKSYENGLLYYMQYNSFCRTLYYQYCNGLLEQLFSDSNRTFTLSDFFSLFRNKDNTSNQIDDSDTITDSSNVEIALENNLDTSAYDSLFTYLSQLESQYNTQIIIFYHPRETITSDGTLTFNIGPGYLETFTEYAESYNITFINMAQAFTDMYNSTYHVPHGFITGKLGYGHLNKYGHKAIANTLADTIHKMETTGEICC